MQGPHGLVESGLDGICQRVVFRPSEAATKAGQAASNIFGQPASGVLCSLGFLLN
jgi:hypothetical protein